MLKECHQMVKRDGGGGGGWGGWVGVGGMDEELRGL